MNGANDKYKREVSKLGTDELKDYQRKDHTELVNKNLENSELNIDNLNFNSDATIKTDSKQTEVNNSVSSTENLGNQVPTENLSQSISEHKNISNDNMNSTSDLPSTDGDHDSSLTDSEHLDSSSAKEDNRSLKEKYNDFKDDLKETKENLKNAPENIKNKIDETKQKLEDTKDKIKEAPENIRNKANDIKQKAQELPDNLRQKRDQVKNAWDNRPKNLSQAKDAFQGSNLKERLANGAKNVANRAKDKAVDSAKNSDLVKNAKRKVDKAKKTVENAKKVADKTKKAAKFLKAAGKAAVSAIKSLVQLFISTLPYSAIVLAVIVLIFLIVYIIIALTGSPGGDTTENREAYSKTDQKTLEKMEKLFTKYPNSDGTLAMATVILPYRTELQDGNVYSYLNSANKEETEEEEEVLEEDDDSEDIELDETDTTENDPMLEVFRSYKVRNRLKKVLKLIAGKSEEEATQLIMDDYFDKDNGYFGYNFTGLDAYNGYKDMFRDVNDDDLNEFKKVLINNILDIKDNLADYVFVNAICSTNLLPGVTVPSSELLKGNVYVDLRAPGCSYGNIDKCPSYTGYGGYLTLEEYVKGVVYEELGGSGTINQLAAQMVAAKSYALARRSAHKDAATGVNVISMKWSTADQDFCHVEKGCNSSDIRSHYGYGGNSSLLFHGANRGPAPANIKKNLDEAWELSKTYYVTKKNTNPLKPAEAGYFEGAGCKVGKCMRQDTLVNSYANNDFKNTLMYFYSSYSLSQVDGEFATESIAGSTVCSSSATNFTAKRNKIAAYAKDQLSKIPYYEKGLASSKVYEENNFNTEVTPDSAGRKLKGLDDVGFVNYVYWVNEDINFGNTSDINAILKEEFTFPVEKKNLLVADIGYSADKSVVGIYVGKDQWAFEDSITGNVVVKPYDGFTNFVRLQIFKNEIYNFEIRKTKPAKSEWSGKPWFNFSGGNTGQCPWYARNRAAEITANLFANGSITEEHYNRVIKKIRNASGNGRDYAPGSPGVSAFKYGSTNINDIKAPAFIGMESSTSPPYGHVAIIEYANPDENKIIVTDGWCRGCGSSCSYTWDCVRFQYKEYTYASFKQNFGWKFRGYVFFLDE